MLEHIWYYVSNNKTFTAQVNQSGGKEWNRSERVVCPTSDDKIVSWLVNDKNTGGQKVGKTAAKADKNGTKKGDNLLNSRKKVSV